MLNSAANSEYKIEFFSSPVCDPSGNGQGRTFVGSVMVMTDGNGDAGFMASFPVAAAPGPAIAATATDDRGATSEFSTCVETLIFADGFESGDTSAWAAIRGSGPLIVTEETHYGGEYGLRILADEPGLAHVRDDSPMNEPRYRVRFYLRLTELVLVENDELVLFSGHNGLDEAQVQLSIRRVGGENRLIPAAGQDGGSLVQGGGIAIGNGWHAIEFDWRTGAGDGYLNLWIDGSPFTGLTGLDNEDGLIEYITWGIVDRIGSGFAGHIDLDDYESRRGAYIGVLPCPLGDGVLGRSAALAGESNHARPG